MNDRDGAESAPRISVRELTKTYHTRRGDVVALRSVSLDVGPGEIMVLLGPSGCGKTTLLRCVAGLESPDSGRIDVQGRTVFSSDQGIGLPPEKRGLSMVFQSYALWPHMSVQDNVAYPLRTTKVKKAEVAERVNAVLDTVGLSQFARSYPGQLSGGQQQRVALARALVASQGVILFDEPLSNLDAKVRERLRDELLTLQADIGFTGLYVTHDQTEATGLGDRIAVMEVGGVAQLGAPTDIYYSPASQYVADFVGAANEIPGTASGTAGSLVRVRTALGELAATPVGSPPRLGQDVRVMFRPEHCRLVEDQRGDNLIKATVERSVFLGSHVEHLLSAGDCRVTARATEGLLAAGTDVTVTVDAARARVFVTE